VTLSPIGKHAIVIGAGMGGLATAAAVSDHFERVTVLERDVLPLTACSRPGTPQDNHLHVLLIGGLRALDELFPGFADDLARAGAVPIRLKSRFSRRAPGLRPLLPTARSGLGLLRYVATAARICRATQPAENDQRRRA
jgi:2-polyprenyl-6-methoxyphenol hydroxylase-like FAD-dependent oxidoreductase